MDLSVVVPVHNEAGNIDPLLQEIHDALEGQFDFQAIFVDDGSRDGTATELAAARTRFPRLRVVTHRETPGLGDKIEVAKDDWILGFNGLSLGNPPAEQWQVSKDGGRFDAFSGATITPRAVVQAIAGGLRFFNGHRTELLESPAAITVSHRSNES